MSKRTAQQEEPMKVTATTADMIKCVSREVKLREAVYPRQCMAGKMTTEQAEHELQTMRSVLAVLMERKAEEDKK